MKYIIDPDEFVPMMADSDLTLDEKRAWILAVVEFFTPLVDAAWSDDAFAHMKAAEMQENAARTSAPMVDYSVYKQSKTTARADFESAGGTQ